MTPTKLPRELAEWRAKYLQERFPRKGPCLIPKPGSCVPSCHENDFCECDMCEITGALYAKLLIDAPVFDEAEVARYIQATWFRNGADFSDRELATIISWLRWQHEQSAAQIAALRQAYEYMKDQYNMLTDIDSEHTAEVQSTQKQIDALKVENQTLCEDLNQSRSAQESWKLAKANADEEITQLKSELEAEKIGSSLRKESATSKSLELVKLRAQLAEFKTWGSELCRECDVDSFILFAKDTTCLSCRQKRS